MIEVLNAGFYTTIQDYGRFHYTQYGIPLSGAMDRRLFRLSNLLLDNDEKIPAIEMIYVGAKLKFTEQTTVCITSPKAEVKLNGISVELNKQLRLNRNDEISVRQIESFAYLAVKNGFSSEKKLNSYSQYKTITKKSKLEKGDKLYYSPNVNSTLKNANIKFDNSYYNSSEIDVFVLPEYSCLNEFQKKRLNMDFTLSPKSNRMAFQLNEIIENQMNGISSKPVMPGTVQLTPEGSLIILMRDAQVTGGYPRIFQLTEDSINRLAQKKLNSKIKFKINKI